MPISRWNRRDALMLPFAAAAATALGGCATIPRAPSPPADRFRHGVASGDPGPDRVVIWTRVTDARAEPSETLWEMAHDPGFMDVVARGEAEARPEADFTVKIDVGGLEPRRDYWYRFACGGQVSPAGRARTLPIGPTTHFRLAIASCAHHAAGWFNAYRAIAGTPGVDLVLHLGDYIYEHGPGGPWTHIGRRLGRIPEPPHETVTLADYRRRYAQYRLDPDLQAAHAAAPWIAIWDDHESADNSWPGGARRHDPGQHGGWPARREAGLRAYYEWMPIREPAPGRMPVEAWRAYDLGDLATLILLETRLAARSPPLTFADALAAVDAAGASGGAEQARAAMRRFLDERVGDPERRLLGAAQLAWAAETMRTSSASGRPWQILANQTAMARLALPNLALHLPAPWRLLARLAGGRVWDHVRASAYGAPVSLDAWDGFPAERERLYAAARAAGANILTLTGDTHAFFAAALRDRDGRPVGLELGTTSVNSPSPLERMPPGLDMARLAYDANAETLAYFNPEMRGFLLLDLTPDRAEATMVAVTTARSRDFETYASARFAARPRPGGGTHGLESLPVA